MSELLDVAEFKSVKLNIKLCEDGKEEWKVDFLEFVNDDCDQSDLAFFYDSLPFVRFLVDDGQSNVAYTTPNKRIYLNAPHITEIGESKVLWESIYFHECLHQLWETFAVGDQIKEELGPDKYNHVLLNIASDCVINEFIMNNMGRKLTKGCVDAAYIKKEFDVEYDRNKDTQFSLYMKLLPVYEKNKKMVEQILKDHPELAGEDGQQGQQGGQQSGNQGGQQGSKKGGKKGQGGQSSDGGDPIDDMSGDEAAESAAQSAAEAQEAANKAKDKAQVSGDAKDKEAAEKAQEAADKAKKEAQKAKEAAKDGDEQGARDAAKEAQKAANEAKSQAGEKTKGADGKSNERDQEAHGEGTKQIADSDGPHTLKEYIEADERDEEITEAAKENIKKHANRISGVVGEFISQTKGCFREIREMRDGTGFKTFATVGKAKWDIDFKKLVDVYVRNQINRKKREMEPTYSRPNRRAGYVEYGKPIKKGQKVKEDKLNISMTFYIDKSGSMSGTDLENATTLAYGISDAVEKNHKHEKKYIEKFDFKFFTFNEDIQPIKKNQKVQSAGGNMSFEELLNVIKKHSIDDMINVIITDAGFPVNVSSTTKFIDSMGGLFIFVTNMDQCMSDYKEVEKKVAQHNFKHILASRHFELSEAADKI